MKAIFCAIIVAGAIGWSAWIYVQNQPGRWKMSAQGGAITKTDTCTGDILVLIPPGYAANKTGSAYWMKLPPTPKFDEFGGIMVDSTSAKFSLPPGFVLDPAPTPKFIPPPVSSYRGQAEDFILIPKRTPTAIRR